MDKYTQLLEFFMENGVHLDREQREKLKAVCEATKDQIEYMKKNLQAGRLEDSELDNGEVVRGFLGKTSNADNGTATKNRAKDLETMTKARDKYDKVYDDMRSANKDTHGRYRGSKNYSDFEKKMDKISSDTADKLFKEKEAYSDNEKFDKVRGK